MYTFVHIDSLKIKQKNNIGKHINFKGNKGKYGYTILYIYELRIAL